MLASTLGALVWNFFFIPPHFTFNIDKTEDILIFSLFFIIALVNGVLTTRVRRQERIARERERRTNGLYQLTKELSKASGIPEALKVAQSEIHNHFGLSPVFILQDGTGVLNPRRVSEQVPDLTEDEIASAVQVYNSAGKTSGYTRTAGLRALTFFALKGARVNPGVLAVRMDHDFEEDRQSYWDTFIVQIANALEREFLGEMAQKVRIYDESDRLYRTLFSSISHELRIPVATIMGASDSILNSSETDSMQTALSQEIFTASLRLKRLIDNLLNMSRLESGFISVRLDWYDLNDLVNKVTEDLLDELKQFTLLMSIPDDMPLVKIDFGLMEQVLYNLLINSTQYAPIGSEIQLLARHEQDHLIIEISDSGPGFPPDELKNVFKKFFRVDGSKTGGLGLGLSIAKGFVEAHTGRIVVQNTATGGAGFKLSIPSTKLEIMEL